MDKVIKVIYSCSILLAFMIPQEISAKQLIKDSNQTLTEYKIQEMEKQIDELISDNKSLSSSIQTLIVKENSMSTTLDKNHLIYDTVLTTTNRSYDFLVDILFWIIGGISVIFIVIAYLLNSPFKKWIESKVDDQLKEMAKDGFSSKIQDWMAKKKIKLKENLEKIQPEDIVTPINHKISDMFTTNIDENSQYIEKYLEAVDNNSDDINNYIILGELYLKNGENKNAKLVLTKAVQLASSDHRPYILLGSLFLDENEDEFAIKNLNEAKNIEQNDPKIYHLLGLLSLKKKDDETAIDYFNKAIKYNTDIVDDYIHLGELYSKKEDIIHSYEIYNKAESIFPENRSICAALGHICYKLDNIGQAEVIVKKIEYIDKMITA